MFHKENNWNYLYQNHRSEPVIVELPEQQEKFGYDDTEIYGPF